MAQEITENGQQNRFDPIVQDEAGIWKNFRRTDQNMPCDICDQPLWHIHPHWGTKHRQPLKAECPTMIEDCAGNWWKT